MNREYTLWNFYRKFEDKYLRINTFQVTSYFYSVGNWTVEIELKK